jgi:hypothetical protein
MIAFCKSTAKVEHYFESTKQNDNNFNKKLHICKSYI